MTIRRYSELRQLPSLVERFRYLQLRGYVGDPTFGFDRYINQQFYRSTQWRRIRQQIIVRDEGCDLGIRDHEIHKSLYIHHMNPMRVQDISSGDDSILDPEYLITVSLKTHNAIHYGNEESLPRPFVERKPGDTKLW